MNRAVDVTLRGVSQLKLAQEVRVSSAALCCSVRAVKREDESSMSWLVKRRDRADWLDAAICRRRCAFEGRRGVTAFPE